MTHADKIRSMSDKELAVMMAVIEQAAIDGVLEALRKSGVEMLITRTASEIRVQHHLKFLQQESDEE